MTEPLALRSIHTTNFPFLLKKLGISFVVSTYQAGKLIIIRADGDKINTHFRVFDKPMGVTATREKMAIGTAFQIWELRNTPAVCSQLEPPDRHDACYLPRKTHITGDIDIHEMAYIEDELWFINTRFSCLCTLDSIHSFIPRWRPPFVSAYDITDRTHLNGLGLRDGKARYVSALGATDRKEGWRKNKAKGGILLDISNNEFIAQGLSMPHSPRWYQDQLWILESGKGSFGKVDLNTGKITTVVELPGFTRGLDFYGDFAFIGLSQVRETAIFSGIPITESLQERNCGVWVVNIYTGQIVAFLKFEDAIQEIFAISVLPGILFPEVIDWDEKLLGSSFILPDQVLKETVIREQFDPPLPPLKKGENESNIDQLLNLGNSAYFKRDLSTAENYYQQCLKLNPNLIIVRYNLGVVYLEQEKWEKAKIELKQVIKADPNYAQAYNNLGMYYQHQHQLNTAIKHYQKAIEIEKDFPDAHLNLSMALLQKGDFQKGLIEWEWRWQTNQFTPFQCPHPQWNGENIFDQNLLVYTEQGAGDAIQFIRYLPLLKNKCKKIIFICVKELFSLFSTIKEIDQILTPGDILLSEFHTYIPLMSLPRIFGTNLTNIPAKIPYLQVPLINQEKSWQNLMKLDLIPQNNVKIGIVWSGSNTHKDNHNRSCSLKDFSPLFSLKNCAFYSLQKEINMTEKEQLKKYNIQDLSLHLSDFGDTAAVISYLDLIITVDTSVAHLAGALGKQVWTLLCYTPDWRWLLENNHTPWYPTMKLFRQNKPKKWLNVLTEVKQELLKLLNN